MSLIKEFVIAKEAEARLVQAQASDPLQSIGHEWSGAANDATFGRTAPRTQKLAIFFDSCANICAKTARNLLKNAVFAGRQRGSRKALAACFFAFFLIFPVPSCSANLSTTP